MGARRLPSFVNNLTPMRAAWLAALVDGEGTISVHCTPNGSKRAWVAVSTPPGIWPAKTPLSQRLEFVDQPSSVIQICLPASPFAAITL